MENSVMLTLEEKVEMRSALVNLVLKACNDPKKVPPEVLTALPAVLKELLGYYGR